MQKVIKIIQLLTILKETEIQKINLKACCAASMKNHCETDIRINYKIYMKNTSNTINFAILLKFLLFSCLHLLI